MDKRLDSKINIFRSASKRNYNKYKTVYKMEKELLLGSNLFLLGKDLDEMLSEYYNQEESHRMAFIVFQAMAIEAFLNEYIYVRVGKLYFNSMDKLSPIDKLLVACKLITGKDFPRNSRAFELLKKTVKYRNRLVHYKVKEIDIQKLADELLKKEKGDLEKDMEDISTTYDKLVETLNSLDDNFDRKYLVQIPDDFWNTSY
nr:MAG TPA: hypothetical protein [Caudoviricetes sp.]